MLGVVLLGKLYTDFFKSVIKERAWLITRFYFSGAFLDVCGLCVRWRAAAILSRLFPSLPILTREMILNASPSLIDIDIDGKRAEMEDS